MEVLTACHLHSRWSYDGSWSIEALRDTFRVKGYRVLLMTEHDRGFSSARYSEYRDACAKASSDDVLIVPGIEYSDPTNTIHVLVWGVREFLGESLPTAAMLEAVTAAGGLAVLAHPSRRYAWQLFDRSWIDRLLGIEVWNRKYDGWAPSQRAVDLLKHAGVVPFVGLDFHNHRQLFPLAMAVDVPATVSCETVLNSLRARRCQARAFGVPTDHQILRRAFPMLTTAEQTRRTVAALVHYTRGMYSATRS